MNTLQRLEQASEILAWMEQEGYEYARFEDMDTSALVYEYEDSHNVVAVVKCDDDFIAELFELWTQATALEPLMLSGYDIENDQPEDDPPWKPGKLKLALDGRIVHIVEGASTMTEAIRALNRAVYMDGLMTGEVCGVEV